MEAHKDYKSAIAHLHNIGGGVSISWLKVRAVYQPMKPSAPFVHKEVIGLWDRAARA